MNDLWVHLAQSEDAASASEYAIVVGVIALAIFAATQQFNLTNVFLAVNIKIDACVRGTSAC